MTERQKKRFNLVASVIAVALLVVGMFIIGGHKDYNQNDHMMEQGKKPVYLTPDGNASENTDDVTIAGDNATEPVEIDYSSYRPMAYKGMLSCCEAGNEQKVQLVGTIYSSVDLAENTVYKIADADGNIYSITVPLNMGFDKFIPADELVVYGVANGTSTLNNSKIPQIAAHALEKIEKLPAKE